MNTKLIVAIGAAAAAAAYFLKAKKQAIENLKVDFLDAYIDKANTNWYDKISWIFKFKLINTESVSITVKNIDLDIIINNKKVAEINSNQQIKVNSNNTEIIRLSTSIQTGNAIILILDAIAASQPLQIKVIGKIITDLGTVNINYKTNADI